MRPAANDGKRGVQGHQETAWTQPEGQHWAIDLTLQQGSLDVGSKELAVIHILHTQRV